ncbi:hypothetical protein [Paraburkholderia terrae]|uniref:hypothetical protein n=1 Tax=Paraburkholderia terrae TaxID=311230 RepID=UPI00069413D4|nr:hypothetical protein [Paraburkholderia terrae]
MQSTTETRLKLQYGQAARLDQMAAHYGTYKRKLYAYIAAHGRNAKAHKTAFCRAHGLSSRLFNALAIEVQGSIDSVRELLKNYEKELQQAIARTRALLKKRSAQRLDIEEDRLRCSSAREARIRKSIYKANCKLQKLKSKLDKVKQRLEANVPGICFGSRKLFKKQHTLEDSGFTDFDAWRSRWQDRRSHDVSFVGSKDEKAGNCAIRRDGNGGRCDGRIGSRRAAAGWASGRDGM